MTVVGILVQEKYNDILNDFILIDYLIDIVFSVIRIIIITNNITYWYWFFANLAYLRAVIHVLHLC